jgi:mannosyltransferase
VNGAIVPAGDADALTAAIEPYFREPDLAKEHGRAALEFVHANFSLAAEARRIRSVYDRLWTAGQSPLSLTEKGQPNGGETEPASYPDGAGYKYARRNHAQA